MNQKSSSVDNMLLQELVRVKKIRFKDLEIKKKHRKVSTNEWQNHANFLEFQSIYSNINKPKSNTSIKSENNYEKPKISCANLNNYTAPIKVKKLPQFIETVNLELPIHYGADRAVQLIENKIRPKRQNNAPLKTYAPSNLKRNSNINNNSNKPKKRVVIVDQLNTIEEVKEITNMPENEQEIEEIEKIRKYTAKGHHKIYNKSAIPITRKKPNTKIMDALSTINEKLRKMQEKYFNTPKIHYKNTSDCCVQSNTVEILYENGKYPDKINSIEKEDVKKPITDFESIFNNNEMQNRIKEMNDLFPEFPKIEETLKEIEGNLGSIILPENNECAKDDDDDDDDSLAEKIVKKCEKTKENKIRFIRNQINEVEDFCDKLSEIAKNDHHQEIIEENKSSLLSDEQIVDYNNKDDDDSNLQDSIKKSNYLSKEFNQHSLAHDPMVKIFSDNKLSFWRNRMKELKKAETPYSVESVTKILDTLKFSLENSLYEPYNLNVPSDFPREFVETQL